MEGECSSQEAAPGAADSPAASEVDWADDLAELNDEIFDDEVWMGNDKESNEYRDKMHHQ
eukprot:gene15350-12219_t